MEDDDFMDARNGFSLSDYELNKWLADQCLHNNGLHHPDCLFFDICFYDLPLPPA